MVARTITAVAALAALGSAESFSIDTPEELVTTAKTLAFDLMTLYNGNETGETPGILPGPPPAGDYYWWEAAGFFATFLDYWHVTGDDSYNDVVVQGLVHQRGPGDNYMPPNITATLGNDDQCGWALASMIAAENELPEPGNGEASWLKVAENVFDTMAWRDDVESGENGTCGGGLRWQVAMFNAGYDFKNTMANGCFFNLAARLARFTGNETYSKRAEKTWDWLTTTGLIDDSTWAVYDGAHAEKNCTDISKFQFSYPAALLIEGVAFMYNFTSGSTEWKSRLDSLTTATLKTFFPKDIAVEVSCESHSTCTTDMVTYKGYLHRYLASTAQLAAYTSENIMPVLKTSTKAAVAQCTGGDSKRRCGMFWADGKFVKPETSGVGEQMSVLGAVESLLINSVAAPVTSDTAGSGTSGGGDSGSGTGTGSAPSPTPSSAARQSTMSLVTGLIGVIALMMI